MNSCRDWAFSNSGLEVGLPDFQLLMFTKCNALPKRDMVSKIFTIQWLCPRFGLQDIDWLCSQLWHVTAANQWTVVEIELLVTAGWKWGCQTFSCSCSQNVMHCRKEICWTCLSKESMPVVKSKPPLPTRSLRSLKAAVRSTSSAICLHHAHPFVAAKEKSTCLMQGSKAFAQAVVVSKICYVRYSDCVEDLEYRRLIVLSIVLCDCCKRMNCFRDWAFSNSGLEVGLPAFQLLMFTKCDALPKGDLLDMFVIPFLNSKHPLSTRSSRFLRAAVRSTSSSLCLHPPHPSVATSEKGTCLIQRSKAFGDGVVVSKILYNTVLVLWVVL